MAIDTTNQIKNANDALELLGLHGYTTRQLTKIYEHILESSTLDFDFQFEALWLKIDEEDRLEIIRDIGVLKRFISDASRNLRAWDDEVKIVIDKISTKIIRAFPFTNETGSELSKGSVYQNLISYWNRYRDPQNKEKNDITVDCKLPTMVLWYILQRESINLEVLIRYLNERFLVLPNFSAHPDLFLSVDGFVNPSPDYVGQYTSVAGVLMGFTSIENGFRNVKVFTEKDINPFKLPHFHNLESLSFCLDVFFFTGLLIYNLRNRNIISTSKPKVFALLDTLFEREEIDRFRPALEDYIDHLFTVRLSLD